MPIWTAPAGTPPPGWQDPIRDIGLWMEAYRKGELSLSYDNRPPAVDKGWATVRWWPEHGKR